ncbi:MAG: GspH/FimT family pseudopilin [Litorilituus sp.]|jgi:type IV fimbrial biogenesis protein FimT|nr:GspH/FimT family pseudopilin [Litorilituus sp.]
MLNNTPVRKVKHCRKKANAFTLLELMTSISITSILATIAMTSLQGFIVQMRVDNEISQLHRMLLITRNSAINSGQKAILCPLDIRFNCTTQWHKDLSIFIDTNDNKIFDHHNNEKVIRIKEAINPNDILIYGKGRNKITFKPTGQLSGLANGTFRYCPKDYKTKARGIIVARSGRVYQSTDINNDGLDENRSYKNITCN